MSPVELVALSLSLSIAVAALGGLTAAGLERISGDARLRDRAWAAALYLPALPPLAVVLMLLTPAPVVTVVDLPTRTVVAPLIEIGPAAAPVAPAFTLDGGLAALIVLAVAGLLIAARLVSLARRAARLSCLVAHAGPTSTETQDAVAAAARSLGIAATAVRATATGSDALLTGLIRPMLILPTALADSPDAPATHAVVTHELAHLKRGDHRAVWIEEALMAALAVNPVLPLIRARRAAAREEACDALALTGADPSARRAYAQSLIEALRARAGPSPLPALTFTGTQRSQAMRRLKSILTPPATAGRGTRVLALAAALALLGLAGAGSMAVAAQRPPEVSLDADAGSPLASRDPAYVGASMNPIYKAAWPGACGFGSEGPNGQVFVHSGEGCPTLAGPRILIQSLEGISPSADPRAAFTAVKAACDAGRPVEIAFSQGGKRGARTVACGMPAVAPPEPVRFTVDLTYDPGIAIARGDTLEIALKRDTADGGTASTDMVLNLAPGTMPGVAFVDLRPPLLPPDRSDPMFAMTAKIVGSDGASKAVSDREAGRPFAPYVIGPDAIRTKLRMLPTGALRAPAATDATLQTARDEAEARAAAQAAARRAVAAARATLTPEQRARFRNPSVADYRRICASSDPADGGFCSGVIFSQLRESGVCPPSAIDDRDIKISGPALGALVERARSQFDAVPASSAQTLQQLTLAALRRAYPCQAASRTTSASLPG